MSSTYIPPALRSRQPAVGSSSSSKSGSSAFQTSDREGYRSGPARNLDTSAYRTTTSYSAPGRPRTQLPYSQPGEARRTTPSNHDTDARTYTGDKTSASSANGAGAYRTPAQRAQDRLDADAQSRQAKRDAWPTFDGASSPSTASGYGNGYGRHGYNDRRGRDDRSSGSLAGGWNSSMSRSYSGPGRSRAADTAQDTRTHFSPSLHVFGDSFVGPMKLLRNECATTRTFKGASAKGLNNPHSAKQVAKQLTPAINELMGLEYGYIPKTGRWILLIFGNVDLQINYLWQLQHKPLTAASFSPDTVLPPHITRSFTDTSASETETGPTRKNHVLANATETSLSGHALGPILFVGAVVKAYTSYLEQEIVNGPIGNKLRAQADKARAGRPDPKAVPGRVLVAAALPPLVQDSVLARIPEKYVERLEDDHKMAQAALRRDAGDMPWGVDREDREDGRDGAGWEKEDDMRLAGRMSKLGIERAAAEGERRPGTPPSSGSNTSGSDGTSTSTRTDNISGLSTAPSTPPHTSIDAKDGTNILGDGEKDDRYSIAYLLSHDPPLCTLPIRARMTDRYNELLKAYVITRPDVLQWIDIAPSMRSLDQKASVTSQPETDQASAPPTDQERKDEMELGIVDRATWACPIDPTNVHPLWEPTIPLWLEEMEKLGLPTGSWMLDVEADETKRAYEEDKRRRTDKRDAEWAAEAAARW